MHIDRVTLTPSNSLILSAMAVMLLMLLVVVSVTVAGSVAPCCFSEKGEGFVNLAGEVGFRRIKYAAVVKFSVDYSALRTAASERLYTDSGMKRYQVIDDYKEKKRYVIYGERKCYVAPLFSVLTPRCNLKNATFIGSSYLGVGASALMIDTYAVDARRQHVQAVVGVTVDTQNNCIPVSELAKGTKNHKPFSQAMSFYNYTLGVKDPAVFVPPKFCGKAMSPSTRMMRLPDTMQRILDFLTVPNE